MIDCVCGGGCVPSCGVYSVSARVLLRAPRRRRSVGCPSMWDTVGHMVNRMVNRERYSVSQAVGHCGTLGPSLGGEGVSQYVGHSGTLLLSAFGGMRPSRDSLPVGESPVGHSLGPGRRGKYLTGSVIMCYNLGGVEIEV